MRDRPHHLTGNYVTYSFRKLGTTCDVRAVWLSYKPIKLRYMYIDDIFMIWAEGLDNLNIFIDFLNNIHSTIKFTSSHSSTNIPALDASVSLTNDGSISTDLYTTETYRQKPTSTLACNDFHGSWQAKQSKSGNNLLSLKVEYRRVTGVVSIAAYTSIVAHTSLQKLYTNGRYKITWSRASE